MFLKTKMRYSNITKRPQKWETINHIKRVIVTNAVFSTAQNKKMNKITLVQMGRVISLVKIDQKKHIKNTDLARITRRVREHLQVLFLSRDSAGEAADRISQVLPCLGGGEEIARGPKESLGNGRGTRHVPTLFVFDNLATDLVESELWINFDDQISSYGCNQGLRFPFDCPLDV